MARCGAGARGAEPPARACGGNRAGQALPAAPQVHAEARVERNPRSQAAAGAAKAQAAPRRWASANRLRSGADCAQNNCAQTRCGALGRRAVRRAPKARQPRACARGIAQRRNRRGRGAAHVSLVPSWRAHIISPIIQPRCRQAHASLAACSAMRRASSRSGFSRKPEGGKASFVKSKVRSSSAGAESQSSAALRTHHRSLHRRNLDPYLQTRWRSGPG